MFIKLGWGTCLFFGSFCFAAGVFSYFMVAETSNKSLEQIAAIFGDELHEEVILDEWAADQEVAGRKADLKEQLRV